MTTIRRTATIAAALLALGALAGCTSNPVAAKPVTVAPTAAASTPVPRRPPRLAPTQVAADATPVSIKCHTLVPTAVAKTLDAALHHGEGLDAGRRHPLRAARPT